jgi:hypothetical protein
MENHPTPTTKHTVTLTLKQLYQLEAELNGVFNPEKGIQDRQGLLAERLPLATRYHLGKLAALALTEKKEVDRLRDELIVRLGEKTEDGRVAIPHLVASKTKKGAKAMVPNPNLLAFGQELEALLAQTREVEHYAFTLSQFAAVETAEHCEVFLSLLTEE